VMGILHLQIFSSLTLAKSNFLFRSPPDTVPPMSSNVQGLPARLSEPCSLERTK
jgi:hypothetical protein